MPRPHLTKVRVRLAETDALGVVYYGNYLGFFDIARLEMLREVGIDLSFLKRRGLGFVAAESSCRYLSSAKFDDLLTLEVRVSRVGGSSVTYEHKISKGRTRVAEGRVTDVLVGLGGKPARIPDDIRERLLRFRV